MPYFGGLYTGVPYNTYLVENETQVQGLDTYLSNLVTNKEEDSVVSIVMAPSDFFTSSATPQIWSKTISRPTKVDGYAPKNKKLLTFPYTFLTVDTGNDSHDYRFEFGQGSSLSFNITAAPSPNPEVVCYPSNYNGSSGSNATESVTSTGFPQCAFSVDSYKAWLAYNATGDIIGTAGTALASIGSFIGGNIGAGLAGTLGVASSVNNMVNAATAGAKSRGTIGSSTDVACRVKDIYFKTMSITYEYAVMIDDYFSRYGYATNKIKVPNRNVRPHWTYTQTRDCTIRGNIPVGDMNKIKSIYNNGVTFWRNGAEVGNYALDNSPS